ncbi:MAG: glycoside hydrolase [Ruminococcus sp.]|nr:glycoside hydrolase [Ruminococcus sp.]MCM1380806.1 hypothetical protein [Muribaculaceae bacterium]MCM1479641.1 hypothetical protein [Muribaculaceae bacterium]
MKYYKKILAGVAAVLAIISISTTAAAENGNNITVYPERAVRGISPYLYGVNSGVDMSKVTAGAFRLGGNRLSAYNWENNMSNAGSDYMNMSDLYLITNAADEFKNVPGGAALDAAKTASDNGVPYPLLTLQMMGYVTSSKRGSVPEEGVAPSEYWVKLENRKNTDFDLKPDKKDGVVYTDEYLNYLINNIGNSQNGGFKGYSLDNEPVLWQYTHSRVKPEPVTVTELIERSVDLAATVKDMDENAEIFGPALFGYSAFANFTGTSDWEQMKADNGYRWFIDGYLDEMKKAGDEQGRRLLDVLDLHFYTEAKGVCGQRSCSHYDDDGCVRARLDSVRSLYDPDYREDSWITDAGAEFFPLLPNLEQSIEKYYPDTKIAFTEYNFGGGDHISGALAEADMLGIFAEYGVYLAAIWSFDSNDFQLAAINMYTNYDGQGSGFGDTLVETETFDRNRTAVYSAVDSGDGKLRVIAVNKSLRESTAVNISLAGEKKYSSAKVYGLYGDSAEIRSMGEVEDISGNSFSYELPPLSVTEFEFAEKETNKSSIAKTAAICAAGLAVAGGAVLAVKKLKK